MAFIQFKIPQRIKNEPLTWVINRLLNGLIKIKMLINISSKAVINRSNQLSSLIFFKRKDKSILVIAKYKIQKPKKIVITWLNIKGFKIVKIPNKMPMIP